MTGANVTILNDQNQPLWMKEVLLALGNTAFLAKEPRNQNGNFTASQKKKAEHILKLKHNGDYPAEVVEQKLEDMEHAAQSLILSRVSSSVKNKIIQLNTAYAMFQYCCAYGLNKDAGVIHAMENALRAMNPSEFEQLSGDTGFAEAVRERWESLKFRSDNITYNNMIMMILTNLPSPAFDNLVEVYTDKISNNEDIKWEVFMKKIEAKEVGLNRHKPNPGRKTGAPKAAQDETTEEALITQKQLQVHLAQVRKELAKKSKTKKSISERAFNVNTNGSQGKKECFNYGSYDACKFGATCKFLHDGRAPTDGDLPNKLKKGQDRKEERRERRDKTKRRNNERDSASEGEHANHARAKRQKKGKTNVDLWGMEVEESNLAVADGTKKHTFAKTFMFNLLMMIMIWITGNCFAQAATTLVGRESFPSNLYVDLTPTSVTLSVTTAIAMTGYQNTTNSMDTIVDMALYASGAADSHAISDTGATCHIIGSSHLFARMFNIKPCNGTVWMNNYKSQITHRGDLRIKLRVDATNSASRYEYLTLHNVAYVPTSSHNLFSVTAFLDDCEKYDNFSAKVEYLAKKSILTLPSGDTYTGNRVGNLFLMEWPEEEESFNANMHSTPPKVSKNVVENARGAKVKKQLDVQETSDSELQTSESESEPSAKSCYSSDCEVDSESNYPELVSSSGSDTDSDTA